MIKPTTLPYHVSLRSIVPIDHIELIFNGRVIASIILMGRAHKPMSVEGLRFRPAVGWSCAPGTITQTRRSRTSILLPARAQST